MNHNLPDYLPEYPRVDYREVLSRKIRQATQLARHCASVAHPLEMNSLLADLVSECEALWMEIEDDGREVMQ